MSLNDDILALRKKRLEEEERKKKESQEQQRKTEEKLKASGGSLQDEILALREQRLAYKGNREDTIAPFPFANEYLTVAPTKEDVEEEEDEAPWYKNLFRTSDAFKDDEGNIFTDTMDTFQSSVQDLSGNVLRGIGNLGEGVTDLLLHGVSGVSKLAGADSFADDVKNLANKNTVNNFFDWAEGVTGAEENSVFGETTDDVAQGVGQISGIILTGGLGAGAGLGVAGTTALTSGLMGASSMGSGISEAYQDNAGAGEAWTYGAIKGSVDAISELLFGGLGKTVKALGLSRGLTSIDDMFARKISSKISNLFVKNVIQGGVKASAEGLEEVIAGLGTAVAKKLTYKSDEELGQLVEDENLLEQFVVGALTSGITQVGDVIVSNKQGQDLITGLNKNETSVVDKVYETKLKEAEADGNKLSAKDKNKLYDSVIEAMDRGELSLDTIEEVLGGDSYKAYKDTVDSEEALKTELEELRKMPMGERNDIQNDRLTELKAMDFSDTTKRDGLKAQLRNEVYEMTKGTRLGESYLEDARRGQAFTADLSKYDAKQQETIKKAIDSGILNNRRGTHEFVDMVAKISADKGVAFDFANNEKLKESGFAIEGKTVNGLKTADGITLNIDSAKALDTVVGHEITHVLEGTEFYDTLQSVLFDYAKSKNDYQNRYDALYKLYEGTYEADGDYDAKIKAEVTADLVGDYLFTDSDFVNNLYTKDRNVFQKIFDEIKYLLKIATAGSKEARELEKVKRAFENAYREGGKAQNSGTQYSIIDSDGNQIDEARISANEFDTKYSISHSKEIAKGQSDYILNKKSHITEAELAEAQRVTEAMVDVMMKYSEILPEDKIGKVLTKNGSYDRSVENTTICVRTLAYNEFVDKVQEEIGRPLTQMESFLVSQKLYDIATEPQCLYCYVSLDRKAFNDMLLRYMQDRDTVIAKYNNSDKSPQAIEALYQEFLHGRKDTSNMRDRFNAWIGYVDNGTQLLSLADIATEDRQSVIKANGGNLAAQLTDARNYAQSASWSKIQKNYVAYRDEILKLGDRVVKNLNEHYGLRWYSFSDYSAAFIVENMQQITDASIRGLKGLAYTKDTDFAEIFAPSGMNINISVFVNQDADGNFFIDEKQSANLEKALELRREYPNVGIVATVTNDDALRWAGSQEWTDVIIPFHIVRTGTDVAEYYKWLNYTDESGDTIKDKDLWNAYVDSLNIKSDGAKKKVSKNIYPSEHKNDKSTYLNLCESRGLSPRFVRFAGEDWYMKLVNETRLSADDSSTLKPKFNKGAAEASFQKFIDKGGYESGWYHDGVDVDAEAKMVAEDVLAGKKANEVDYGRQDGFVPEELIANRKTNRQHGRLSLSEGTESVHQYNEEMRYIAPVSKTETTVAENAPVAPVMEDEPVGDSDMFPDNPTLPAEDSEDRMLSLDDDDVPVWESDSAPEPTESSKPADPFEERDWKDVGNRKTKAYMYENPEVKPFFQEAAEAMLGDLQNSVKGERWYNDELYYESGGEYGYSGTERQTTDDIAYLLDEGHYTYAEIEKGLKAIIEDNGAENNACSKRIEFLLNDRLRDGYTDVNGYDIPANQDYLNLLTAKNVTEYSEESWNNLMAQAENTAPVQTAPVENEHPVKEAEKQEAEKPERKTAKIVYDEMPQRKKLSAWKWAKEHILSHGAVFEDLSLETGNRELQARFDSIRRAESMAQHFIGNGKNNVSALKDVRSAVESSGKTESFNDYMYHLHNIDRMSLETEENRVLREGLKEKLKGYSDKQIEKLALEWIRKDTPEDHVQKIKDARAYVDSLKEKNKPVFGDDVTAEVSKGIVAELEAENPEFKEYAEEIYGINRYLREMLVENGVISGETSELWEKIYPHYVPIHRVNKNGQNVNVPLDTNRTGVNAPIKRAKGGNDDFYDLFRTMAERVEQTYKAVSKNRFGVELKNTLGTEIESELENEVEQYGILPEGTKVKAHDRENIGVIKSYNEETGKYAVYFKNDKGYNATVQLDAKVVTPLNPPKQKTDVNIEEIMESVDNHEELLQKGENGANPTFTVFENGKRVKFEITDEMYEAMKPNQFNGTIAPLNNINNWRRNVLTTWSPTFALTNPIKDVQDILMNSQHPAQTYKALPKAIKEVMTKGQWYQERMEHGGDQDTYFDGQVKEFVGDKTGIQKFLGKLQYANEVIEQIPRMAEYIASREMGRSIDVSMLDAARVTTNFGASGDLTNMLNRNGATFLSASVEGFNQQVRNIREAKAQGLKGWGVLAAKTIVAGLPAMLLNHLLWDDDEEYEELSDYVKQNYYIVGKFGDGKFVRIPKGRTVAVIQDALKQMENLVTGNDEVDLMAFADLVKTNLAPNNVFDNNIIAPITQAIGNNAWYGGDLVPTRLQDLPKAEQFDETTDSISKWLGEVTNTSPYKWNYVIDQYTGGAGDILLPYLTPSADGGGLGAAMRDKFTTDSTLKNQSVTDFYDTNDKLAVNANSMYASDEDVLMSKYMNTINSKMGELYGQKREVQNSNLSDKEKNAQVRELQSQINALAREGLNTYGSVKIDNGYATVGDVHYRKNKGEWTKITDDQLDKQIAVTSDLGISPSEYWSDKNEYDFMYEYPEKHEFFSNNGISYDDYADADEDGKRAYNWAYENPGKYTMSKAFSDDFLTYYGYRDELNDIEADKDEDGKSISGSKKEKVISYINNMDLDYGQKIILFRSMYSSKEDRANYNADIVEYLNGRDDISYEDMVAILKELDMKVSSDGSVTWD